MLIIDYKLSIVNSWLPKLVVGEPGVQHSNAAPGFLLSANFQMFCDGYFSTWNQGVSCLNHVFNVSLPERVVCTEIGYPEPVFSVVKHQNHAQKD